MSMIASDCSCSISPLFNLSRLYQSYRQLVNNRDQWRKQFEKKREIRFGVFGNPEFTDKSGVV